jgi:putative PIN family toxin of toxin-antitoxin system
MLYLHAAARPKGAAAACFDLVEQGHVRLFASPAILDEVFDVLDRPKIRAAFPKLTDEQVDEFLEKVKEMAQLEADAARTYSLPRDPDDEPYLNLALVTHSSFLVSRDHDLLSLMTDEEFRKAYPALTIIEPPAFLAHVRAEISKEPG